MNTIAPSRQNVLNSIDRLQLELELTFQGILAQTCGRLEPEQQADVEQKLAGTRQLLEGLKLRYDRHEPALQKTAMGNAAFCTLNG